MTNVPDNWHSYYHTCERCGHRYHASEGGCDCPERCDGCGDPCEDTDALGLCFACSGATVSE